MTYVQGSVKLSNFTFEAPGTYTVSTSFILVTGNVRLENYNFSSAGTYTKGPVPDIPSPGPGVQAWLDRVEKIRRLEGVWGWRR